MEEHVLTGGLGSAVLEVINDNNLTPRPTILRLGIPNTFSAEYGSQDSLLASWDLSSESLVNAVKIELS